MQKLTEKISGIYCIENMINNKKYIGQSINVYYRWSKHKYELKNNSHDNDFLQKSWNKYGEDNFSFYIIEECESSMLDEKEKYYINLYNTLDRNCGYNLKEGGKYGAVTDYGNEKRKQSLKDYYNSTDAKERQKQNALKQWSDPNIKSKIMGENNGMYGKTHTLEAKEKISKANKGRISKYRNNNKILCVELNKIFSCAVDAAKELNIQTSGILQVCYGNRNTAGGYHWEFYNGK